MNFESFSKKVKDEVMMYVPEELRENATLTEKKIEKVNGTKSAIILDMGTEFPSPVLYLEDLYEIYKVTGDADAVVRHTADVFAQGVLSGTMMKTYMEDVPGEDQIILTLVNTERNGRLLKNVPHRPFLDLSVIYRYYVPLPDGTFNLITVTNDMMKEKGYEEEQLYHMALDNTERLLPPNVEEVDEIGTVVTNQRGLIGSAAILYPSLLQAVAEESGGDMYIIPSSVHEVIAIPSHRIKAELLQQMILEANRDVLRPEDILSDSLYCFRPSCGELELVGMAALS